jgi:protein arginine N-methyltransferase 2
VQETVRQLTESHDNYEEGLKILNIGFGLGIIDSMFQQLPVPPSLHVIVEAHPDVLAHMRSQGWHNKPNVRIVEGKWQDAMNSEEVMGVGGFDVVYTDTFSEDYMALREFFDMVPDLLNGPESRFSFFNGLGATNATFYDVYTRLSDMHLSEVGLGVRWSDVDNPITSQSESERWGKTKEYFTVPLYRLPIASMSLA